MAREVSFLPYLHKPRQVSLRDAVEHDEDTNSFSAIREKMGAFCMGTHKRLGSGSIIYILDPLLVQIIGEQGYQDAREYRILRLFKGVFGTGDLSLFTKCEATRAAGKLLLTTDKLKARLVTENEWVHGTADVHDEFTDLVNITEAIKKQSLQGMNEIRLGQDEPEDFREIIRLELAPECTLEGLTKICSCGSEDTHARVYNDRMSEFAWNSKHRCLDASGGGMHLFAKNWQARIQKIFRDVPLVWSKDVRDRIVHKGMLPLLAELIVVDSCVFPIYKSSFSEEWKHTIVMDEDFTRDRNSMTFFTRKDVCGLFYRGGQGATSEKQAYRSWRHNFGVLEWHDLGSMLSLDFASHFWQLSHHCSCVGCVPL